MAYRECYFDPATNGYFMSDEKGNLTRIDLPVMQAGDSIQITETVTFSESEEKEEENIKRVEPLWQTLTVAGGIVYICPRCGAMLPRGFIQGKSPQEIHRKWHAEIIFDWYEDQYE